MTTETVESASRVIVEVAPDHLSAHVRLVGVKDSGPPSIEEIVQALTEAKVAMDDNVTSRVQELVQQVADGGDVPERFAVAEGRPAGDGQDGDFVWADALQQVGRDWQADEPVNYYKMSTIITVGENEALGTLVPATPGAEGVDVHGQRIKPKRQPAEITLGDNVTRSPDDPNVVLSKVPGRVVFKDGKLAIVESLQISTDVDFETGSVEAAVDVQVGGTIREQFEVKTRRSVVVGGAVEGGVVDARKDVTVRGGILGRRVGRVVAGGEITARFCENANLAAQGNISVCKAVVGSRIHTDGMFLAAHAAVIGGRVYARQGADVGALGSEAGVPTRIMVGVHPDVFARNRAIHQEIDTKKAAVEKIRQTIQPLEAQMKRLTPQQRERVTELLFAATELEQEIENLKHSRDKALESGQAEHPAAVLVAKSIHERVTISVDRRQTTFDRTVKGPVRIEARKIGQATELACVNQLTGSLTVLPSSQVLEVEQPTPASENAESASAHATGR